MTHLKRSAKSPPKKLRRLVPPGTARKPCEFVQSEKAHFPAGVLCARCHAEEEARLALFFCHRERATIVDEWQTQTRPLARGSSARVEGFPKELRCVGSFGPGRCSGLVERSHTVDFVHFHRDGSSYGAASNYSCSIRVHFGIRVLNDSAETLALNGPSSSEFMGPKARYHHRFNAKSGSQFERRVADLVRFVSDIGEPWFASCAETASLLDASGPLTEAERAAFRLGVEGELEPSRIARSRRLLGIAPA